MIVCAPLYLKKDDREAAVEDPWVGSVRDAHDFEEHAGHPLRGREDFQSGEPEARAPVHRAGTHLVLQADESDGHRCGRRRERRPLHQSFLPSQLLRAHRRRHDLDSRRAQDSQRRGADLQLQHGRRRVDQMPLPPGMSDVVVRPAVYYLHGFASSAKSTKAAYFAERLRARDIALACPDFNEPDFQAMTLTRMLYQLVSTLAQAGYDTVVLICDGPVCWPP